MRDINRVLRRRSRLPLDVVVDCADCDGFCFCNGQMVRVVDYYLVSSSQENSRATSTDVHSLGSRQRVHVDMHTIRILRFGVDPPSQ